MPKTSDVIIFFENAIAPISRQSNWDNSGTQLIVHDDNVNKIAIALDISEDLIKKADSLGCNLFISHHPLFFDKIKSINNSKYIDRTLIYAIKNDINILSYHTNLDAADYNLSQYLLDVLGATTLSNFAFEDKSHCYSYGRTATLNSEINVFAFINNLKKLLNIDTVRTNFGDDFSFKDFAIVSGSGASFWKDCLDYNIKVLLTGDMKHHDAIDAYFNGVYIIDIGHFAMEQKFMRYLSKIIYNNLLIKTEVLDDDISYIYNY